MNETKFTTLGLSDAMLKSLRKMGFESATPVQAGAIQPFMRGEDLLVEAPTGTGKTCAFGIPIIENIDMTLRRPQTLILSPTRELALQTATVLRQLAQHTPGVKMTAIYGGENINRQFAGLRQNPHIIIATPGRLVDHLNRGTIRLDQIRVVVLDEADRMLDMGFRRDLNFILDKTPKARQTALFSATLSDEIMDIARAYQHKPSQVKVNANTVSIDAIRQYFAEVAKEEKNTELFSLLKSRQYPLSLVFVRTKRRAASLAIALQKRGFRAGALHGNMSQPQRDRVMKQYRQGELDILVATDIAARGLDVQNIDAVINYDLPEDSDAYTHRIGRTGRAQQRGIALTFVDSQERSKVFTIARNRQLQFTPCDKLASVL